MQRPILILVILFLAQGAFAQTPPRLGNPPATTRSGPPRLGPAPSTATTPTPPRLGLTTTSKPAIDRTAPDKTWAALCAAAKAADLAAFRACWYNKNEIATLFLDTYSDKVITAFQLAKAVATLGPEGQAMSTELESVYADLVKSGQNRTLQVTGDSAKWIQTVSSPKVIAEQVMYFKKVGNQWLLDTQLSYGLDSGEGRKGAEDFVAQAAPELKQLKAILADINAKKITTIAQLKVRMAAKPAP